MSRTTGPPARATAAPARTGTPAPPRLQPGAQRRLRPQALATRAAPPDAGEDRWRGRRRDAARRRRRRWRGAGGRRLLAMARRPARRDRDLWLPIGPAITLRGSGDSDPRVAGRVRDIAVSPDGQRVLRRDRAGRALVHRHRGRALGAGGRLGDGRPTARDLAASSHTLDLRRRARAVRSRQTTRQGRGVGRHGRADPDARSPCRTSASVRAVRRRGRPARRRPGAQRRAPARWPTPGSARPSPAPPRGAPGVPRPAWRGDLPPRRRPGQPGAWSRPPPAGCTTTPPACPDPWALVDGRRSGKRSPPGLSGTRRRHRRGVDPGDRRAPRPPVGRVVHEAAAGATDVWWQRERGGGAVHARRPARRAGAGRRQRSAARARRAPRFPDVVYVLGSGPRLWRIDGTAPGAVGRLRRPAVPGGPRRRRPVGLRPGAWRSTPRTRDRILIGGAGVSSPHDGDNAAALYRLTVRGCGGRRTRTDYAGGNASTRRWVGAEVHADVHRIRWSRVGRRPATSGSCCDGGVFRSAAGAARWVVRLARERAGGHRAGLHRQPPRQRRHSC